MQQARADLVTLLQTTRWQIMQKTNEQAQESTSAAEAIERSYVLNTNTKRFHYPDCSSVDDMKAKNRSDVTDTREHLIELGYKPCARCNP